MNSVVFLPIFYKRIMKTTNKKIFRNFLQKLQKTIKYLTNWRTKSRISQSREVKTPQKREVFSSKNQGDDISDEISIEKYVQTGAGQCPYCSGKNISKRGKRQKKFEIVQLYFCKKCQKTFTPQTVKGRHYPLKVILDGLSFYNLGYTLEDTTRFLKEKYGLPVKANTIANWLENFKELCKYSRMRKFGKKLYSPQQTVQGISLYHRQIYKFRIHRAKLALLSQEDPRHYKLSPLREFLEAIFEECPHHLFKEGIRASEVKVDFNLDRVIIREKHNFANRLAKLVLQAVEENKFRHEALQKFFICNDSVTVATEVPIYLLPEDIEHMESQLGFEIPVKIDKVLTGHIDLLQLRNGAVHILDYKNKAAKERPIEQLTLYAMGLSRLTGLRLYDFKCGWFDEKDYFEFFPLHVVYKLRERQPRIPKGQPKLLETREIIS